MTHTSTLLKAKLAIMSGIVGVMSLAGAANAGVIYYGDGVSFREAKRMCAGIHGRVFLSEREVYACQGDRRRRRVIYIPPPPPPQDEPPVLFLKANDRHGKEQNLKSSDLSHGFGKTGGEGSNGGGGGNGRK